MVMSLSPHPRLLVDDTAFARLTLDDPHPVLVAAREELRADALRYRDDPSIAIDWSAHSAHLIRARHMQKRIITLLIAYRLDNDAACKHRALEDLRAMGAWEYWSWITWREQDPEPTAIFDLSYGENSATLALAYDWLYHELADDEREELVAIARRRSIVPYLSRARDSFWFNKADSNWNTVCNGGAGMLALAMYEERGQEADATLALAEEGSAAFFAGITASGGWPEGIGYWNYGMRYGFWFLLSWERARGAAHPAFAQEPTARTLAFPLRYSPHGVGCSFGDVNGFAPLPFHLAAAVRCERDDVLADLLERLRERKPAYGHWPVAALLLLLWPERLPEAPSATAEPLFLREDGLDWYVLADRWPDPQLYCSVRGGTTDAPHTHQDLGSFQLLSGAQVMICNVPMGPYLDSTFSPRRFETYEASWASKNGVLVNGVGQMHPATVRSEPVETEQLRGVLLDGAEIFGPTRDGSAVQCYRRAIYMLADRGLLVLDRVVPRKSAVIEARFHSFADLRVERAGAEIVAPDGSTLQLRAAADSDLVFHRADGLQTHPVASDVMLRVRGAKLVDELLLATWLAPGADAAVAMQRDDNGASIHLQAGDWEQELRIDLQLYPQ